MDDGDVEWKIVRCSCRSSIFVLAEMLLMKLPAYRVNQGKGRGWEDDHDFFYRLALVRQSCSHGQRFLSMTTAKIQIFHVYWSTQNYTTKLTVKWPFAHDHDQIFGRRSMVFQIYAIVIGRCDGKKICCCCCCLTPGLNPLRIHSLIAYA